MLCKGLYLRGVVCGSYVGLVGLLLDMVCLMGVWQLGSFFFPFVRDANFVLFNNGGWVMG